MIEPAVRIINHAALDDSKVSYWKNGGDWFLYLPYCGICRLTLHSVVEHEDGTISVTPSVLMTGHKDGGTFSAAYGTVTQRHGFLTRGQWHEG